MRTAQHATRILVFIGLAMALAVSPAPAAQSADSAGLIHPGAQPAVERSDSAIKEDLVKALGKYKDARLTVEKRVVTLSGKVHSDAERLAAIEDARKTPGVLSVRDQMEVASGAPQSAGEYLDDAAVTAAVKSKIFAEKGLSSLKISVDTDNGVVTLTGSVKSQEHADLAGQVARSVKGVKSVTNKLLVNP